MHILFRTLLVKFVRVAREVAARLSVFGLSYDFSRSYLKTGFNSSISSFAAGPIVGGV